MSAAQELAGYAGGDAVAAEAAKVENADTGAITAAATRLSTAASDAGAHCTEVATAVASLDQAWEGASADQFVAYMNRFGRAGADIGTSMTTAADALTSVVSAIDGARSYIADRCEQALTEIRQFIRREDPQQDRLDAYAREVCGEVAGDLRTKLRETEQALSAAAGAISGAPPASLFSSLPDPNTQTFTPQPGQQLEWTRTPPPETTTAAGNDEQPGRQPAGTPGTGGTSGGSGGGSGSGDGGGFAGGGGGMGSSGGPPAGGPPPGNVQEWIRQAIEILRANGINVTEADAEKIWQIIQHESGGNPHAINNWDSNAAKGTPSKGLMQTIDPTFDAYQLPGHGDIWNPVDNICAGVNYAISRYGSLDNVPGIKAMASGGAYRGY